MANTLKDLSIKLLSFEDDLREAEEEAIVRACKLVKRKAKGLIGVPQPYWQPLKPETIAHKRRGNTPLLETGELRASISWSGPYRDADNDVYGYVGSDNIKARYHELGTATIPPRSFLMLAAMGAENEIHELAEKAIESAWSGGSMWKQVFDNLSKAWDRMEPWRKDFEDGDDDD